MLIDLSSLSANTQTWAKATDTADVSVTVDGTTRVLTGLNAAAYLFGQALGSVQFHDTLDGVQLTDGRFEFPPASDQWVSLSEVADALRYKYGVDPLIEFAPGLGLRGYSVADINGILDLLNEEFADQFSLSLISSSTVASATQATFNTEKAASGSTATYDAAAVSTLLDTASTPNLASATEAELRQELTEGGDLYTDRAGAFYLNGVRTSAIDVAVVSRLLVQDNIASEYKVLMDEYADRNNMIAAAHRFIDGGLSGVSQSIDSAEQQYGWSDALSELTSGQYSDDTFLYWDTDVDADTVTFDTHPGWVTGTQVRIGASMGGLTAGTDYFVRSLGNGAYSFFTTQANALANTSVVDLTEKLERTTNVFAQDAVALSAVGSSNLAIQFNPAKIQGASLSDYDLMANSYYFDLDGNSSSNKDNYLIFSPIDPGWPEDTALEFKSGNGGLTAGTDYYVANWYSGGEKRVQLTGGPGGNANTEDNKLTGKPSGPVMLYDSGAIAGQETIQGYNQFTLPNTNFATGTACRPKEDVHVLLTHTQGTQHYYKAVVAMKAGQEYFLRNDGDGKYSIYDTSSNATRGTEEGRLYFQIDDASYNNAFTKSPYITETTATVNGLSSGLDIYGGHSEFSFAATKDPLWADGTAVRTKVTGGGLTAGVTYYTRQESDGQYFFYTSEAAALSGGATDLVPVYGPPLPGGLFRVSDEGLELSSLSSDWDDVSALLNTLISNKVRDGDLDQAKLQTLTAQLQNNTEAMTALVKAFMDLNSQLAQALR